MKVEEMLREEAGKLLAKGEVKCIIGWERVGSLEARPLFAKSPEESRKLHYSPLCSSNLATYFKLNGVQGKIGLVVKGCDSRAVVQLIQEKIVDREKVVLLGVPCAGVVDSRELEKKLRERGIQPSSVKEISIEKGKVRVEAEKPAEFERGEIVSEACINCQHPTPVLYDSMLGEAVNAFGIENYGDVKEIERMTLEERRNYWVNNFERCIRCYACREACPLCYCKQCSADKTTPVWMWKSVKPSENAFFHLMRAFHMAGRCVGCGACERSCPRGIPLLKLFRKMEKDVKEMFGHKAGMDVNQKPLLATFSEGDSEEFIG